MNKRIEVTLDAQETILIDVALRKYWGIVKRNLDDSGVGHETLRAVNKLRQKLETIEGCYKENTSYRVNSNKPTDQDLLDLKNTFNKPNDSHTSYFTGFSS